MNIDEKTNKQFVEKINNVYQKFLDDLASLKKKRDAEIRNIIEGVDQRELEKIKKELS